MSVDLERLRELRRLGVSRAVFDGERLAEVSFYEMTDEERGLSHMAEALEQQRSWQAALDSDAMSEAYRKAQEELVYGSST